MKLLKNKKFQYLFFAIASLLFCYGFQVHAAMAGTLTVSITDQDGSYLRDMPAHITEDKVLFEVRLGGSTLTKTNGTAVPGNAAGSWSYAYTLPASGTYQFCVKKAYNTDLSAYNYNKRVYFGANIAQHDYTSGSNTFPCQSFTIPAGTVNYNLGANYIWNYSQVNFQVYDGPYDASTIPDSFRLNLSTVGFFVINSAGQYVTSSANAAVSSNNSIGYVDYRFPKTAFPDGSYTICPDTSGYPIVYDKNRGLEGTGVTGSSAPILDCGRFDIGGMSQDDYYYADPKEYWQRVSYRWGPQTIHLGQGDAYNYVRNVSVTAGTAQDINFQWWATGAPTNTVCTHTTVPAYRFENGYWTDGRSWYQTRPAWATDWINAMSSPVGTFTFNYVADGSGRQYDITCQNANGEQMWNHFSVSTYYPTVAPTVITNSANPSQTQADGYSTVTSDGVGAGVTRGNISDFGNILYSNQSDCASGVIGPDGSEPGAKYRYSDGDSILNAQWLAGSDSFVSRMTSSSTLKANRSMFPLIPSRTYYYKGFATNTSNLTGYGSCVSFTTLDATPVISLSAQNLSVQYGEKTTMSWTLANVDHCTKNSTPAGWNGTITATGSGDSSAIVADTTFWIECFRANGTSLGRSQDVLVKLAGGNCIYNGGGEINAMFLCKGTLTVQDNSQLTGSFVAKNFNVGANPVNVNFFFDYNIDSHVPPGFRTLIVPKSSEVGNKP